MKFSSRAAAHVALSVALAAVVANCARNREPEPGSLETVEDVFRASSPGLRITRTSNGGIAVQLVRGPSSFYSSNEPLYIIDGMPFQPGPGGALNGVNPHDIASIKVLKDPADTSVYGMRGANGVIVITTKKPGGSTGG
ncbi:MAG TPA: TonB-dependent receptor plug domain-containing protein [Gemmatimonadaceae bacterium]|jgi:TonB-dependent SusC/RagA subfamily outer membrane receptor